MVTHDLYIKNMVCGRCKSSVRETLEAFGFEVLAVDLGKASLSTSPNSQILEIERVFREKGFEILIDVDDRTLTQIKAKLVDYLEQIDEIRVKVSDYLAKELGISYAYLSKLFSKLEGQTIEKYFIRLKIEKVKELLSYQELSLSEISYRLKYSSVQALSSQFRKITGISVSEYKENGLLLERKELDRI